MLVLVAALSAGGCGASALPGQGGHAGHDYMYMTSTPPIPGKPARPMTMDQLADEVGCTPERSGKALDFRQGTCRVDGDILVMNDFDTEKAKRDWLTGSELYGGIYLVGPRWVLSGNSLVYMKRVQQRLGGTIEIAWMH